MKHSVLCEQTNQLSSISDVFLLSAKQGWFAKSIIIILLSVVIWYPQTKSVVNFFNLE